MPTYREVKGLDVMALGEGKKIGTVDDLLVDPDGMRVVWLRVSSGKLLGGSHWLPIEAVRDIDGQAVAIDSEADERDSEGAAAAVVLVSSAREVIGKRVINEQGAELGKVRDYSFALNNFTIATLQLARQDGEVLDDTFALDTQDYHVRLGDVVITAGDHAPT